MSKEILEQLFDSPVKVKLLKLFLRNSDQSFSLQDAAKRTRADLSSCRRQIQKLESIKLLNVRRKSNRKFYSVNSGFAFYKELGVLVLKSSPASKQKILKQLKVIGKVNLVILSGVFVNAENARVDLLVVGDRMSKSKFFSFIKDLEAEVGKEIDYVILSTDEFKYRYEMFDRFIRDVLEKPHEKLINKLRIFK